MKLSLKQKLRIYLDPSTWIRLRPSSKQLSRKINELLDNKEQIIIINKHITKLGPLYLWTSNYPYCYGCLYGTEDYIPDRRTVYRLYHEIKERGIQAPEDFMKNMKYEKCDKVTITSSSSGWFLHVEGYPTKHFTEWRNLIENLEQILPPPKVEDIFKRQWEFDECWCNSCCEKATGFPQRTKMIVCPNCGNKRCPKAEFHGYKCTNSNEPNQTPELEDLES